VFVAIAVALWLATPCVALLRIGGLF